MFHILTESHPAPRARPSRYIISAGIHGAVILGVAVFAPVPSGAAPTSRAVPLISLPAPRSSQPISGPPDHPTIPAGPSAPIWESGDAAPDLDAWVPAMAVSGVEDMLRRLGTDGHGRVAAPDVAPSAGDLLPLSVAAVDDPVLVIHQPTPRYPEALARAGVAGRVELEYVVDTTGRAEPGTVRALGSTHPAFEAAARASVLAARYRPARLRGDPVRQLVRQTLAFRPAS